MMKINVVSKKLIKPCVPTPESLKKYNISCIDELNPPMNVSLLLLYQSEPIQNSVIVMQLQESLGKILPQFYPLAGTYTNKDDSVDCSDEGAEFIIAEAFGVELIDVVGKTTSEELLTKFLPRPSFLAPVAAPVLSIQMTELESGGLVMGISVSHRIVDTCSVKTFLDAWTTYPGGVSPNFDSPSLFPGQNIEDDGLEAKPDSDLVVRRFFFNGEAIACLRSKVRAEGGPGVSRVRVVSALLARALIRVDRAKHGKYRACVISQPVNIRGRTIPPLPKQSCGNLVLVSATRRIAATETEDIGIQELVDLITAATEKTMDNCAKMLSPGEDRHKMVNESVEFYRERDEEAASILWFTDMTKFGFYDVDFGWGKPVWVAWGPLYAANMVVLVDNKGGDGMQALVHLNHKDMSVLQQDHEIKLFTTT